MELTIDQALQKAVEAHKAGKVQDADRLYTAILAVQPKHPDANHNLGVLAISVGKLQEALPFLKTALEANPSIAQFWLSYIDALIKLGRITDAKAVLDQAKRKGTKGVGLEKLERQLAGRGKDQEPPQQQVQNLIDLYTQGQYLQVLDKASQLLQQFPNSLNLHNIIGTTNKGLGRPDKAIEAYKKALAIKPNFSEAYNNMGVSLKEQGKLEEAIEAYKKALAIKPDYVEVHNNMGVSLKEQGKLDEAIEAYNKALTIKPDYVEALNNIGNVLQEQGKLEEAIEAYNKALTIKPDYAEAYNNMGVSLNEQGKLDEAIEAYNKALTTKPDYAQAYNNATELLKTHSSNSKSSHNLFNIDNKIKNLSSKIICAKSNNEIINYLIEGFDYISDDSFHYKTPLSQIYKSNNVDLNCKRHMKIFDTKNIIPSFCFGCFKVQVELTTFIDLVKLTSLFYKFDFEEDLTKKTMIELRPNIPGYYKGLVYCKSLDQAEAVKILLDRSLKEVFGEQTISKVKRGCSEYPLKFPSYGEIPQDTQKIMRFPKEWAIIETKFDQDEFISSNYNRMASLPQFCLSDFYIIQKWIDYAKGIGDQTIEVFNDRPIVFTDIYEKAKIRAISS